MRLKEQPAAVDKSMGDPKMLKGSYSPDFRGTGQRRA